MTTTKRIELTVAEKRKQPFDVELPLYRKHDTSGDSYETVHYTRINEDLTAVTISKNFYYGSREIEYSLELTEKYEFDSSDANYHLGLGEYKSSKGEFEDVLKEMREALNRI